MADRKNLAAYTPPGANYPPYISINFEDHLVEVTVRSPAQVDGQCGHQGAIKMPFQEFQRIFEAAVKTFRRDIQGQSD